MAKTLCWTHHWMFLVIACFNRSCLPLCCRRRKQASLTFQCAATYLNFSLLSYSAKEEKDKGQDPSSPPSFCYSKRSSCVDTLIEVYPIPVHLFTSCKQRIHPTHAFVGFSQSSRHDDRLGGSCCWIIDQQQDASQRHLFVEHYYY